MGFKHYCPFCGSRSAVVDRKCTNPDLFRVVCDTCGASGPVDARIEWAVKAWNVRHEADPASETSPAPALEPTPALTINLHLHAGELLGDGTAIVRAIVEAITKAREVSHED